MVSIRNYPWNSSLCQSQIFRSHTLKWFMAIHRIWGVGPGLLGWEAFKFIINIQWLSSLFLPPLIPNGILRTFPDLKYLIFLPSAFLWCFLCTRQGARLIGNTGQINENNGVSWLLRETQVCRVQGGGGRRHRRNRGWHPLVGSRKTSFLIEVLIWFDFWRVGVLLPGGGEDWKKDLGRWKWTEGEVTPARRINMGKSRTCETERHVNSSRRLGLGSGWGGAPHKWHNAGRHEHRQVIGNWHNLKKFELLPEGNGFYDSLEILGII